MERRQKKLFKIGEKKVKQLFKTIQNYTKYHKLQQGSKQQNRVQKPSPHLKKCSALNAANKQLRKSTKKKREKGNRELPVRVLKEEGQDDP